ncbi:uncharacterized protein C7orf78 homolog [Aulostomus maculatus]
MKVSAGFIGWLQMVCCTRCPPSALKIRSSSLQTRNSPLREARGSCFHGWRASVTCGASSHQISLFDCTSLLQFLGGGNKKLRPNPPLPRLREKKQGSGIFLPTVWSDGRKEPPRFIASRRVPDALETELMFVKTGKLPAEPYRNPKPHDFRPLDEDLPDMDTWFQRDPANLGLKSKHLDIMGTTRPDSDLCVRASGAKMDTHKLAEPRWDARLILPRQPWPPKSASYTRHRRRRGAYSAFLDRVEEKLTRTWKKPS